MYFITNEIKEYFNIKYNLYRFYPKEYIKFISLFDKLSFEYKIKTIYNIEILDYEASCNSGKTDKLKEISIKTSIRKKDMIFPTEILLV